MPKNNVLFNKFNRGKIDIRALGREDLEDSPFFAEEMTNFLPEVLGNMSIRPGTGYKTSTYINKKVYSIPFVKANTDKTFLEFSDYAFRAYDYDNEVFVTRPAVSTAITNSAFTSDLADWTDADESGSSSVWATGGYMSLTGNGFNYAIRNQTITIALADQNVEHAIRLKVVKGKVRIKAGSTAGATDYLDYDNLSEGEHSLAFTPTGGSVYLSISSLTTYATLVDSCAIEAPGYMVLPTVIAEEKLGLIRKEQSLDVIYITCNGYKPFKVERRGSDNRSWSIVKYLPEDGPFRSINTSQITIAPSALVGDITLTASKALFNAEQVGGLFKITSGGQQVLVTASGENQFTDSVKVTGTDRTVSLTITGTWVGTVTVQRSFDEGVSWRDYSTYVTNATPTISDGLTNQIVWYRAGIDTGDYTSGDADITLDYPSGTTTGIARISSFTSTTVVNAYVLKPFGSTTGSDNWYEGEWSDYRGYPTSLKIFDGRLSFSGNGKVIHSETDVYEGFSDDNEADNRYFQKLLGRGPTQNVPWMLALQRLILGGETSEYEEKSSSLDEAITATNANIKAIDNFGSALVDAVEVGDGGIFVDKSSSRIMSINALENVYVSYSVSDLMKLIPNLCGTGCSYIKLGAQRRPDTRFHGIRTDGKVDIMVFDQAENVKGWATFETDGFVEDLVILPAEEEEEVYYVINRSTDKETRRYYEKMAMKSETYGGVETKLADSFIEYSGVSTTTIAGIDHLIGETVCVWGNEKCLGNYTVDLSGEIEISEAVTYAVVGLPYEAVYKTSKMMFGQAGGTSINQTKRISQIGLLLYKTHQKGIQYSTDGVNYDDLPTIVNGVKTDENKIWDFYDQRMFPIDDSWTVDSRVYLKAQSPKPCTVLALAVQMKTNDKG